MSDLASVIVGDPDEDARTPDLRQGVVTSTSPLLVRVGSATTGQPARALATYSPTVGDVVSVLVLSGDRLVLGSATSTGGGGFVKIAGDTMTGNLYGPGGSLNFGVAPGYGGPYRGVSYGNDYLIMSDGTNTFVSAISGGTVYIRAGANGGYGLNLNPSGGHVIVGNLNFGGYDIQAANTIAANNFIFSSTYGGGWFMSDNIWIRAFGNKNIYTPGEIRGGRYSYDLYGMVLNHSGDTDTGLYHFSDGAIGLYAQGTSPFIVTANRACVRGWNGSQLNLYEYNDDNHTIRYNAAITGVEVAGYADVRLFTVLNGNIWDFYASGDANGPAGHGWYNTSSIKVKKNVEDLDTGRAVEIVKALRPVTFDLKDDTLTDLIGFIAEWTDEVMPQAVTSGAVEDGKETLPGVDYAKFTPVLTTVLQDVLGRLERLEER